MTIGKPIGGGRPDRRLRHVGRRSPTRILADADAEARGQGGVGGTLAGNALSLAAVRATLEHVLTEEAFARMIALGDALRRGRPGRSSTSTRCRGRHTARLPRRVPFTARRRRATAPSRRRPTTPSSTRYMHLSALNRGILMTPFHNMALMCRPTSRGRRRPPHAIGFAEASRRWGRLMAADTASALHNVRHPLLPEETTWALLTPARKSSP